MQTRTDQEMGGKGGEAPRSRKSNNVKTPVTS